MLSESESSLTTTLKQWYLLAKLDREANHMYPGGGNNRDAYWRTLCANSIFVWNNNAIDEVLSRTTGRIKMNKTFHYLRVLPEQYSDFLSCYMAIIGDPYCGILPNSFLHEEYDPLGNFDNADKGKGQSLNVRIGAMDQTIRSAVSMRRISILRDGYMGLGPTSMWPGDLVYVLMGGAVPFVLRPTGVQYSGRSGFTQSHKLIGDCYVHGVMDGQATDDNWKNKLCRILLE